MRLLASLLAALLSILPAVRSAFAAHPDLPPLAGALGGSRPAGSTPTLAVPEKIARLGWCSCRRASHPRAPRAPPRNSASIVYHTAGPP